MFQLKISQNLFQIGNDFSEFYSSQTLFFCLSYAKSLVTVSCLADGAMTSQVKWFLFGAALGLPASLLASQLHSAAAFDVAVAMFKKQWCYRSTLSEANALKASLPSIPNLQRIREAQSRLVELDRRLEKCGDISAINMQATR